MPDKFVLGLFHEATPTADALDALRKIGIPDGDITVMSAIPYRPEMLGRRAVYERLWPIAALGALSGLLAALFLVVGTPLLYPLNTGKQGLVPFAPSAIICFEFTMLGAMVATFAGIIAEIWLPKMGSHIYDIRISEGHIGVLARVPIDLMDRAEQALQAAGAHHLQRIEGPHAGRMFERRSRVDRMRERYGGWTLFWGRWIVIGGLLTVPTLIGLAFAYSIFFLPIPNQMVDQISLGYEYGPRVAAPALSVPVQGAALIADQPATKPEPASPESIARGKAWYGISCRTCHGDNGDGKTIVGAWFGQAKTPPANLKDPRIKALSDQQLFVVLTNGFGNMPRQVEILQPSDRWDVINYVRTMQQ